MPFVKMNSSHSHALLAAQLPPSPRVLRLAPSDEHLTTGPYFTDLTQDDLHIFAGGLSSDYSATSAINFNYTLESPLDLHASPISLYSEYLSTPMFDSSTPMLGGSSFEGLGELGMDFYFPLFTPPPSTSLSPPSPFTLSLPDTNIAVSDSSLPPPPHTAPAGIARKMKTAPTGFRGASTPLLPLDAPIQPRTYVTPSTTSRKTKSIPIERAFAKRQRTLPSPPTPSSSSTTSTEVSPLFETDELPADLLSAVERKRHQNTVSARRSRARKQERLGELEDENERLRKRVEELEARVRELEE